MRVWIKRLHGVEDALLVSLLAVMIGLAATQILLRNFFDSGLLWADPLLRVMVLWLGLIGATVATRENKHIRIDLVPSFFKPNTYRLLQFAIGQISAWTCLVIAWFGAKWIQLDYNDGVTSFAGIPAWILEIIVPISFALIGLRYFVLSIGWAQSYRYQARLATRTRK